VAEEFRATLEKVGKAYEYALVRESSIRPTLTTAQVELFARRRAS
jgi:hypothetical protein